MRRNHWNAVCGAFSLSALTFGGLAEAAPPAHSRAAQVIDHWTPERRASAQPRDLVIDSRGLGYLRRADGSLKPHGHQVAALAHDVDGPAPMRPSPGDTTPPSISAMSPAAGDTIGTSATFSATVTDDSGLRSVTFVVQSSSGATSSFSASASGDTYVVSLQGFTEGQWSWQVVAKDGGQKGGNTATSEWVTFTVGTAPTDPTDPTEPTDPPPDGTIVVNDGWSFGGAVQDAAGRVYFEMPTSKRKNRWAGYVCSGTVATDDTTGRSVIITAAHCVYDDAYKAFARNVLFIPNQDGTNGTGTDQNCSNDPIGCWATSFGVVDVEWTTRTFPDNIPWDYAYYVVDDAGAHTAGINGASDVLDLAAGSLPIDFSTPLLSDRSHALGYSYSDDPNFMYCAEGLTDDEGPANWWLPSCGLSGGASGGPWVQPMDEATGSGPIFSVNSWGYTTSPGMAGPRLDVSSASCLFAVAKSGTPASTADGEAGIVEVCP